ncbi:hypothetical protein SNE40_016647 [Patella caerulea]|uniref:Uncharacterized protein n=1 Tax=Patella caerulea TaxID=87958 RepID=A0AAN8J8Y2_PATCE
MASKGVRGGSHGRGGGPGAGGNVSRVDKACVETEVQIILIIVQVSEELVMEAEVITTVAPAPIVEEEVKKLVEFLGWPVKVFEVGLMDEEELVLEGMCLGVDKACVETDVQIILIIVQVSEELVMEAEVITTVNLETRKIFPGK